jgi:hypothetical protein
VADFENEKDWACSMHGTEETDFKTAGTQPKETIPQALCTTVSTKH